VLDSSDVVGENRKIRGLRGFDDYNSVEVDQAGERIYYKIGSNWGSFSYAWGSEAF